MTAVLSGIVVYPVKSMGGIPLDVAELDEFGLRHDRRWMVVDAAGRFQTQRWRPRMALVHTRLEPDGVRLSAPGMPELLVPPGGGESAGVGVWNDICSASSCGPDADVWLSSFLGDACRLVFMPETTRRPTRSRRRESIGRVSFADAYPFLLLSEGSLADLNGRLPSPVPMNRFRPNLIVNGVEPYGEDRWQELRIGTVDFVVTKPCVRCVLTTVDQSTGVAGKEPLRTLATYRKRKDGVEFGVNLAHLSLGTLRVGDRVVGRVSTAA